ncbi:MAG: V-type ATP synthase subunit F [Eubacterium sp.]
MSNEAKMAVIGDRDSIMIFQALGFYTVYADKGPIIEKEIHRLAKENYAVIYITEQAAVMVPEAIERYKTEPFPAIIPIPNRFGTNGLGMKGIKDNIEKAIGADIL